MKTKVKALILPLLTNPLSWSQCSSRARSAKKAQKADQKAQQTAAEQAEKVMNNLDGDSGTGPDLLPALILKKCAKALSIR